MLKKSASTIGKSLTGPTLMVLKGLGKMSWLYYDTYKLLDVLIFSEQDDKRWKKKWTVQCSVVKVLFKGVWVALEDINMLFSLSLLKIQSFQWHSERWLHMSDQDLSRVSQRLLPKSLVLFRHTILIFFNKHNKLEIEAKVTIGVKWTFQAVAKIG